MKAAKLSETGREKNKATLPSTLKLPKGVILQLENDIPLPHQTGKTGVDLTHPKEYEIVKNMKVGQDVLFHEKDLKLVNKIRYNIGKKTTMRYQLLRADDKHFRMWRVKDGKEPLKKSPPNKKTRPKKRDPQ